MKIIRIEQDRIKVILSKDDLTDMNIDIASLTPDSPELSLFLCEIMDAVKAETGFSVESGQVIVEAAASGDGIILLLSRTGQRPDRARIRGVRAVRKNETVIFEFSDFDDIAGLLANIDGVYVSKMRLYICFSRFYLAVPRNSIPVLIYEYSMHNRRTSVAESILREHGQFIAEGTKLCKIADILKKIK